MPLPAQGQITFSEINLELGLSSTQMISLNDAAVRGLIGKTSEAQFAINELYGASSNSGWVFSLQADSTGTVMADGAFNFRCRSTASATGDGVYIVTRKFRGGYTDNNRRTDDGFPEVQITKIGADGDIDAIVSVTSSLYWIYHFDITCLAESGSDAVFWTFAQTTNNGYTNAAFVRRMIKFNSSLVEQAELKMTAPDMTGTHTEHAAARPTGHYVSDGTYFYQAYKNYSNMTGANAGQEGCGWRKFALSNIAFQDSYVVYATGGSNYPTGIGRDSSGNMYMSMRSPNRTSDRNTRWQKANSSKVTQWHKAMYEDDLYAWFTEDTVYDSSGNAYSVGDYYTISANIGSLGNHPAVCKVNSDGSLGWHKILANAKPNGDVIGRFNFIVLTSNRILCQGAGYRSGRNNYGTYLSCFDLSGNQQWDFIIEDQSDSKPFYWGGLTIDSSGNAYSLHRRSSVDGNYNDELFILKIPDLTSTNGGLTMGTFGDFLLTNVNHSFADPPSGYVSALQNTGATWNVTSHISLSYTSATDISTSSESGSRTLQEGM